MTPQQNTKNERRRRPKWLASVERLSGRLGVLLIVLSMLLWGVAHEITALVLAAASVAGALVVVGARAWSGREVRIGWPALALSGLAAVVALQLVPMPPAMLGLFSPAAHELYLSAHAPLGLFPVWRPLSLDPPATLFEVARLLGLACLFVLLDHRARASDDGRHAAILWPALVVAALAALALSLHTLGLSSLFGLWSTDGTSTVFVSPFRNDNHFAGALVVSALVLLGFAAAAPSDAPWRKRLLAVAATVCAVVVFLGSSMGAFVALGAGIVVFSALNAGRRAAVVPVLAAVALAAVAALAVVPDAGVWAQSSAAARSGKLVPMVVALDIANDFPVFGSGGGSFRTLHDRYLTKSAPVTYTHVENEPLQAVAEFGWPIGVLVVGLALFAVFTLLKRGRMSLVEAGAAAAAVALALHNLVDFSLHYAGAYLLVGLLATGAAKPVLRQRGGLLVAASGVVAVAFAFLLSLPALSTEEARLETLTLDASVSDAQVEDAARALLRRRPASYVPAQAVVTRALAHNTPGFQARWLQALLALAPTNGHAHLLAGESLARIGAKTQALVEFRQAARLNVPSMDRVLGWYPQLEAVLAASPLEPLQVVDAAKILVEKGRADWALAVLKAARTGPHRQLDGMLTDLLTRAGELEEALVVASALRAEAEDWNFAWRAESLALHSLGRKEEAGAVLEAGLLRLPGDYMLGVLSTSHHLEAGRLNEALTALSGIDAGDSPTTRADVARRRSIVFERMGKSALALGEMRTAVGLDPHRDDLRVRLARLCLSAGLYDEAARVLKLATPAPEVEALSEEIQRRR